MLATSGLYVGNDAVIERVYMAYTLPVLVTLA